MSAIWFIHCPRTGGTSIVHSIKKFKTVILIAKPHTPYTVEQHKSFENKYGKVKTLTVLRDPLKHSMSYYSYIRASSTHFGHKLAINNNFSNWLRKCPELPNYFVKFWSTWDNPDVLEALEKLRKIDYILDTADLTIQFRNVLAQNDEPNRILPHVNSKKKYKISSEDADYVKKIRAKDYELLKSLNIKFGTK